MAAPQVISRAEWGALGPTRIMRMATPVGLVFVHHTVSASGPDVKAILRAIQRFHMQSRGYSDIAYSHAVDEAGRVYVLRGWNRVGAHTLGFNSKAVAIVYIGNAEKTKPSEAAIRSIAWLIARGIKRGKLTKTVKIKGHRDVGQTSCPGRHLYEQLPAVRRLVARALSADEWLVKDAKGNRRTYAHLADALKHAHDAVRRTGKVVLKRVRRAA